MPAAGRGNRELVGLQSRPHFIDKPETARAARNDPQQFIAKWQQANLPNASACQQHFLDLCDLLGQPKPAEADPDGAWYTFERASTRPTAATAGPTSGCKDHFGWEYKGKHKDLDAAYRQLLAIPRSPRKPAAAGRLRPRPLRDPHQLHRHREKGSRLRPRRAWPSRPTSTSSAGSSPTPTRCEPGKTSRKHHRAKPPSASARLADGMQQPQRSRTDGPPTS